MVDFIKVANDPARKRKAIKILTDWVGSEKIACELYAKINNGPVTLKGNKIVTAHGEIEVGEIEVVTSVVEEVIKEDKEETKKPVKKKKAATTAKK